MAANDSNPSSPATAGSEFACLSGPELTHRLGEETNRAARHRTPLCCLLVTIGNLEELAREHGSELPERALDYVAAALRRQLRNFDRVGRPSESELLLVLPGADGPRGEVVARRVLERLRTIKIEADGRRRPLLISVGLAAWREDQSPQDLIAQARAAARTSFGAEGSSGSGASSPPALGRP